MTVIEGHAPAYTGSPSLQEETLLALQRADYSAAANRLLIDMNQGYTPNILSMVCSDLLFAFAEHIHRDGTNMTDLTAPQPDTPALNVIRTRQAGYDEMLARTENGDGIAIVSLAKYAQTTAQLRESMGRVLDSREIVAESIGDRKTIQLLGSFNPQHIGHRTTMMSALRAEPGNTQLVAQVVDKHPIKGDSLPPYRGRYFAGEEKLVRSTIIDPTRVTQVHVPAGVGYAMHGSSQIELLTDVSGDDQMRWLVGSDKFMSDVKSARLGKSETRANARFLHPRMHLYVARRAIHDQVEIEEAVDYIHDTLGTAITVVEEPAEANIIGSSASLIRQLRQDGKHQEADQLESSDLRDFQ